MIIHDAALELTKPPEERSIVLDDLMEAGLTLRLLMSCMERHILSLGHVFTLMAMLRLRVILPRLTPQRMNAFRAKESDIVTLLLAVSQHQNQEWVVKDSWEAFCFLMAWEIERYQHRPQWQQLQDNGTIALVLNCMRAFPDNSAVIRCCVYSLGLLVDSHGGNSARIADQGGLDEVVTTMIRFPEDLEIKGCSCLFWMLLVKPREGPVPDRCVRNDAVAEVLAAMRQFRQSGDPDWTPFLDSCIRFLVSAADKERIRREIHARNGVVEIVAAMNYQPDVRDISSGEIRARTGVVDIAAAMNYQPDVRDIPSGCIDLFCQIARSGQHDDVLLNGGALVATLAAMKRFQSEPRILDRSCQMIRCLSDPQRERGRLLVEEGAVEALVSVFQAAEHPFQDLPVDSVRRSLAALLNVVTSPTNLSDEQVFSIFNVCETAALGAFSNDAVIGATVASLAYVLVRFHRLPSL